MTAVLLCYRGIAWPDVAFIAVVGAIFFAMAWATTR